MSKQTYLGDGLYAEFDGFQLRLWANRAASTHEVFLEPETYRELVRFAQQCGLSCR